MIIKIQCAGCRQAIHETVQAGYSLGPILKRHGWIAAPSGFYCSGCSNDLPIRDFAEINLRDNARNT